MQDGWARALGKRWKPRTPNGLCFDKNQPTAGQMLGHSDLCWVIQAVLSISNAATWSAKREVTNEFCSGVRVLPSEFVKSAGSSSCRKPAARFTGNIGGDPWKYTALVLTQYKISQKK